VVQLVLELEHLAEHLEQLVVVPEQQVVALEQQVVPLEQLVVVQLAAAVQPVVVQQVARAAAQADSYFPSASNKSKSLRRSRGLLL
jgi:Holliday junction resolvasome RuvABC endonuclease subunit